MAGYYLPGMTEEQQRALSAKLDAPTRANLLAAALAKLPACSTPSLQSCVHDKWSLAHGLPCQTINDGWVGDFDKMEAAFTRLTCCEVPSRTALALGALGCLALGIIIGRATR